MSGRMSQFIPLKPIASSDQLLLVEFLVVVVLTTFACFSGGEKKWNDGIERGSDGLGGLTQIENGESLSRL